MNPGIRPKQRFPVREVDTVDQAIQCIGNTWRKGCALSIQLLVDISFRCVFGQAAMAILAGAQTCQQTLPQYALLPEA